MFILITRKSTHRCASLTGLTGLIGLTGLTASHITSHQISSHHITSLVLLDLLQIWKTLMTDWVTTSNQEMLAHLKKRWLNSWAMLDQLSPCRWQTLYKEVKRNESKQNIYRTLCDQLLLSGSWQINHVLPGGTEVPIDFPSSKHCQIFLNVSEYFWTYLRGQRFLLIFLLLNIVKYFDIQNVWI